MSNEETFGAEGSESNPGRRRVLKAAAWSAPVIALAVATPMASASVVVPPASVPTTFITGQISAASTATQRIGTYENGSVIYNSANTSTDTGNIFLEFGTTNTAFAITYNAAAFTAAGWTLVSATPELVTFMGPPLANGSARSIPSVTWTGLLADRATLSAGVYAENSNVADLAISARFR